MAQTFQADATFNAAPITLTGAAPTNGPISNPLSPPYGTFKAQVIGLANVFVGAGTTSVQLRLRRNPSAENLIINSGSVNVTATPGAAIGITVMGVDSVPDGRQVQYVLEVTQIGGTGNGTILVGSSIATLLMSG